jgi:hypothetical protein
MLWSVVFLISPRLLFCIKSMTLLFCMKSVSQKKVPNPWRCAELTTSARGTVD